jgi:hypothetical protein
MPQDSQPLVEPTVPGSGQAPAAPPRRSRWLRRTASVLFIVFCLELGLFLLIYPWTDSWTGNYVGWMGPMRLQPEWHEIWNNWYLRGAVSGIGLLNIWVAIAEALRMYIGSNDDQR